MKHVQSPINDDLQTSPSATDDFPTTDLNEEEESSSSEDMNEGESSRTSSTDSNEEEESSSSEGMNEEEACLKINTPRTSSTVSNEEEESSSSEGMNEDEACLKINTPRTSSTDSSCDSIASSDDTCMICMQSIRNDQQSERMDQLSSSSTEDLLAPLLTNNLQENFLQSIKPCDCSYTVHARCLIQWYSRQPVCPICRTTIITRNNHSSITTNHDSSRRLAMTDPQPENRRQIVYLKIRTCLEKIGYCLMLICFVYIVLMVLDQVPPPTQLNITLD